MNPFTASKAVSPEAALLRLGLPLASVPTEKKYALLRIGLRGDTSPPNGSCRGTKSYAAGTIME
jgi:hypothetical protein